MDEPLAGRNHAGDSRRAALSSCDYTVEGDYSQAAFPAVLGAVTGGVAITGLLQDDLAGRCGHSGVSSGGAAQDSPAPGRAWCLEKAPLHGTDIDLADCPDLGPVLMVLGLLCEGTTVIRNAERLRIKESDRIEAMETELRACGGRLESEGGTITIHGCAGALHAPDAAAFRPQRPPGGHEPCGAGAGRRAGPAHQRGRGHCRRAGRIFWTAIKPLGAEVEHVG